MSKTFQQSVEFSGVTAAELFRTYLSTKQHTAAVGAPAFIENKVGGAFRAFGDDGVKGTILALVPDRMIVQSWRGQPWQAGDLDSIVVLIFEPTSAGATIHLTHANVPERAYALVNERAWNALYWGPWQRHFAARKAPKKRAQSR